MTESQPWENLAGGTTGARALRQSKVDMLKAEKEGGTSVSKRVVSDEAGETGNVGRYSKPPQ